MKEMLRVSGPIQILNQQFKLDGYFTSGAVLPYRIDMPGEVLEGILYNPCYYLTVIDGKLCYLHEDAKSAPAPIDN